MMVFWMVLCTLASATQAATPDEIRSAVRNEMSQRHPEPTDSFWSHFGPEAVPVLREMYSESHSYFEKSWLIDGLGHFSDPSVGTFLESEISGASNVIFKKKLLNSLVQSQGEAALGFVEPYLRDSNPHIRLDVARSIQRYASGKKAEAILAKFSENEKMPWVRSELKRTSSAPAILKAIPSPTPLPESAWSGKWEGTYLTPEKSVKAVLELTLLNSAAEGLARKWKVELRLSGAAPFEVKGKPVEINCFQTAHRHWLEVRNSADDGIFMGARK